MTTATDRADQATTVERLRPDPWRIRRLQIAVAAMAILALGLGVALFAVVAVDDEDAAGDAPSDVVGVLDDFATAFADQDVELMESIITDDFAGIVDVYNADTAQPAFTVGVTPNVLLREVRDSTFVVERSGDLVVAGDGPWVIGSRETWTDPSNREEGDRIYVVVDDDGTPRLAGYYYVAVKVPVLPDFDE